MRPRITRQQRRKKYRQLQKRVSASMNPDAKPIPFGGVEPVKGTAAHREMRRREKRGIDLMMLVLAHTFFAWQQKRRNIAA
jgi:hypothetical protein